MKYQSPTGMHDIFELEELHCFDKISKIVSRLADFYGFNEIKTPLVEFAEIFEKGTGGATDIVEKEMYTFRTKGGDSLALRPEMTPGIVRAYIEHGMQALPKPVNMWYLGPVFRHERPQAGRYRQFHQAGFESLGSPSAVVDALIVLIFYNILKELGFKNLVIEVNSIGDAQCRPHFKKALTSYYRSKQASLCADCKRRLKKNPLRLLDCKEEKCQRIKKSAPQIVDHLCKDCHNHFKIFLEFLDELEIPYTLNPYLVRGLDYYTKTVFEIIEDTESGRAQGSLAGGGRYDDLVRMLGGKETPACGAALGVERIINLMKEGGAKASVAKPADLLLAQVGEAAKKKALKLLEEFRKEHVKVIETLHKDSLSSQLKLADKLGIKQVLILGQKEALNNEIILREMETGHQKTFELDKVVKQMKKKLK